MTPTDTQQQPSISLDAIAQALVRSYQAQTDAYNQSALLNYNNALKAAHMIAEQTGQPFVAPADPILGFVNSAVIVANEESSDWSHVDWSKAITYRPLPQLAPPPPPPALPVHIIINTQPVQTVYDPLSGQAVPAFSAVYGDGANVPYGMTVNQNGATYIKRQASTFGGSYWVQQH